MTEDGRVLVAENHYSVRELVLYSPDLSTRTVIASSVAVNCALSIHHTRISAPDRPSVQTGQYSRSQHLHTPQRSP